jgi:peptidoglycan/xylan/chitin deacetylase (PgdA/CDA1 family)
MFKKILFLVAYLSGINYLFSLLNKNKLYVVGYHSVSSNLESLNDYANLSLSKDIFIKQIEYLIRNGHSIINFKDIPKIKKNEIVKPTIIYFDDGFKDNLTEVLPICKKYSIPFTVFIVPEYADSPHGKYMNWDDIRLLAKNDVEIGSHTYSHAVLTEISNEDIRSELVHSKDRIEKEVGVNVPVFSYPKGRFDANVVDAVKGAGYKYAVTTRYGINSIGSLGTNLLELKKVAPRVYESFFDFKVRLYSFNLFK